MEVSSNQFFNSSQFGPQRIMFFFLNSVLKDSLVLVSLNLPRVKAVAKAKIAIRVNRCTMEGDLNENLRKFLMKK